MRSIVCATLALCALALAAGPAVAQQGEPVVPNSRGFNISWDELINSGVVAALAKGLDAAPLAQQLPLPRHSAPLGQQQPSSDGDAQAAQRLQEEEEQQGPSGLLVFLDCERRDCDLDYLRREITFINYVRDRRDAQIHVLVTTQRAGAGEEFTFGFIGLGQFEGDDHSFTYTSSNTDTEDETRAGVAQMLRVGILHYLVKTPLINNIEIRAAVQTMEQRFLVVDPTDDPWNFWVFRFGLDGRLGAEDRRSNRSINFSISANRTTEEWKQRFSTSLRYDDRKFVFDDGSESFSFNRIWWISHKAVKSLGGNWGIALDAALMHATFVNIERVVSVAPGIEYNIFPYSESSRRSFTITYQLGGSYNQYIEETIFGMTEETLFDHSLLVDLDAVQPWGEVELGMETAQFFNDLSQWRLVLEGRLEFRIIRGLNFDVSGNWAAIHDQRFIAAGGQTDEEILLERRALATDSRYSFRIGFNYTFGSIFNNVVNPRFSNDFNRFF